MSIQSEDSIEDNSPILMNFFDFKIAVINERQRELEEESTERIRYAFGRRFIRRDRNVQEAGVLEADAKFALLKDAGGLPGASTRQEVASGIRLLAKGSDFDAMDEYFEKSKSSSADYFVRFLKTIIKIFGNEYLRKPNAVGATLIGTTSDPPEDAPKETYQDLKSV
ncbi:hypothetical protein A0J61_06763 [Choanephora cucurbitarum]|uniref:Uncharacterized protein n=1 Tax=Choanephora cucurbitarum TaxID=101091 RepID=A0A1C7N9A2_9FUNG|nr:hypothetical protein A0J61_06763 [Choanephora cucurbitarum]